MRSVGLWLGLALLPACASDATPKTGEAPIELSATVAPAPSKVAGVDSSTRVSVTWAAPGAHHIRWTASNAVHTASGQADASPATIGELQSATEYTVTVEACADAACVTPADTVSATLTTPEETWQLMGTGHTYASLAQIVSDGNAKIWGLTLGADAGTALAGKVQLYYGTTMSTVYSGQSLAVATGTKAISASDTTTWYPLTNYPSGSGLVTPNPKTSVLGDIMTGQAVPLRSGGVRLYFESNGSDGHARILSVGSADGYTGVDFNTGTATVCKTSSDYAADGGCPYRVELGVTGDTEHAVPKVANIRQFKIGYPTLDDWRWDGAAGTFMFFTVDQGGACGYSGFANQAYAVWDGTQWEPELRGDGCPAAIEKVQAPAPVHVGGVRYKMYHGDPSDRTGALSGSPLPFLGPKRVFYGDGARSGDAARVDFADWETTAHDLTVLWPDGTAMTAGEEGYIDDFVFLVPTGDLDFQLAYVVITDGKALPKPAVMVLKNP